MHLYFGQFARLYNSAFWRNKSAGVGQLMLWSPRFHIHFRKIYVRITGRRRCSHNFPSIGLSTPITWSSSSCYSLFILTLCWRSIGTENILCSVSIETLADAIHTLSIRRSTKRRKNIPSRQLWLCATHRKEKLILSSNRLFSPTDAICLWYSLTFLLYSLFHVQLSLPFICFLSCLPFPQINFRFTWRWQLMSAIS